MGLHCEKEGSLKKKQTKQKKNPAPLQKKPKIKEKIKNKNSPRKKNPPKQNLRVLLKTIPNKSEMKNKYKTKLKKICIYPTPTVFWLTIFIHENVQLTIFTTQTKPWGY